MNTSVRLQISLVLPSKALGVLSLFDREPRFSKVVCDVNVLVAQSRIRLLLVSILFILCHMHIIREVPILVAALITLDVFLSDSLIALFLNFLEHHFNYYK